MKSNWFPKLFLISSAAMNTGESTQSGSKNFFLRNPSRSCVFMNTTTIQEQTLLLLGVVSWFIHRRVNPATLPLLKENIWLKNLKHKLKPATRILKLRSTYQSHDYFFIKFKYNCKNYGRELLYMND